ncbi:translation initiation factor 2, partial [Xanthomonas citri pv. citri]|nr:translation initiation factor 2 [Xanthomonas citri pv. citri]
MPVPTPPAAPGPPVRLRDLLRPPAAPADPRGLT